MGWALKSAPIRTQIILLSLAPILILAISTTLTKPLIPDGHLKAAYADRLAGRVRTVADLAAAASQSGELETVMRLAAAAELQVENLNLVETQSVRGIAANPGSMGRLVEQALQDGDPQIDVRSIPVPEGGVRDVALVSLDPQSTLAISLPTPPSFFGLQELLIDLVVKLVLLILPLLILAIYAGRTIAAPLMRFAKSAEEMGPNIDAGGRFPVEGCREVRTLAIALNEMRGRVVVMLENRRSTMRAVSHDLRTPLTRLRLRAERCDQPELREALLGDVTNLHAMVENCLLYLSNPNRVERLEKVNLASLMQTICNDFSDIGVDATYIGPSRFSYNCKPEALLRAVTNLVANAARFATTIQVHLEAQENGVSITVVDDGPGIPADQRSRMMEPFAKGDSARATQPGGGFGLGLSIVTEIARSHGGHLTLTDNTPKGLCAKLDLRCSVHASGGSD